MSISLVNTAFASLAMLALVGAVGWIAASRLGRPLAGRALPLAWLVAATSMSGSLYYSEIAGYIPCELCWWQRIAMYPLVLVLGIAVVTNDHKVRRYVGPVSLVGAGISAYHVAVQKAPSVGGSCSIDASCTAVWVDAFGWISIPVMALCGFIAIATLMYVKEKS